LNLPINNKKTVITLLIREIPKPKRSREDRPNVQGADQKKTKGEEGTKR